jgi:hypothetical protein
MLDPGGDKNYLKEMKQHSRRTYLRLCRQRLEEIARLPKTEANKPVFERLKREASAYLEKAKKVKA